MKLVMINRLKIDKLTDVRSRRNPPPRIFCKICSLLWFVKMSHNAPFSRKNPARPRSSNRHFERNFALRFLNEEMGVRMKKWGYGLQPVPPSFRSRASTFRALACFLVQVTARIARTEPCPYFKGIAGNLFNVRFAGSTRIPTDSRAVTPSNGSEPSGPKITRPHVSSPMNSISAAP